MFVKHHHCWINWLFKTVNMVKHENMKFLEILNSIILESLHRNVMPMFDKLNYYCFVMEF